MSGIIHKESLPGQGLIKRRRLDAQPTSEDQFEAKEEEPKVATAESAGHSGDATHLPPASGTRTAQSESGSSSSSSDDDDDDEIERENARLAKLREQRNRRQQTQAASGSSGGGSGDGNAATAGGGSGEAERTNSYDHDVLFRNAAWRTPTKAATPAEKRKQKWDSVLNRTQDSAAYSHFMKNFFK